MEITVDRTSVAAGDDALPHVRTLDVPADASLGRVVAGLLADRYLATVAGGRATWILTVGGEPVGVVAQQWAAPRYLVDADRPIASFAAPEAPETPDPGVALVFRYWKQHDPDGVLAALAAGRWPAR
ncbi:hypothetical protein FH609_009730 [Streptomyces sp. 3MP-14]|uniref:Uncharacterized protein n=1 Tax=Streptomyces mimosae TaxID=2586635 RepID=A0A5N6AG74_9ACTN|nr:MULTISPECIES: hypothetical protein [Streptomyces]KAB8167857.1 hypothetical protein FH607_007690 [Streptomyces mimosae]KAB8177495.1 hypothetical protein FH609_009730 [Streptomyces sp. 3MP-14]